MHWIEIKNQQRKIENAHTILDGQLTSLLCLATCFLLHFRPVARWMFLLAIFNCWWFNYFHLDESSPRKYQDYVFACVLFFFLLLFRLSEVCFHDKTLDSMDDVLPWLWRVVLTFSMRECAHFVLSKLSMCKWWKILKCVCVCVSAREWVSVSVFICDEIQASEYISLSCPPLPFDVSIACTISKIAVDLYALVITKTQSEKESPCVSHSFAHTHTHSACLSFQLCCPCVLSLSLCANSSGSYSSVWCLCAYESKTIRQVQVASEMNCKHRKQAANKQYWMNEESKSKCFLTGVAWQ